MARILLCDDSNIILRLLEKRLRDEGHEVVGKGKDGEEGVILFKETTPDLTLLDITMPNKDGRECLEEILKINPLAKVIMVSALSEQAVVQECLALGAKCFIAKSQLNDAVEFKSQVMGSIDKILKAV